MHLLNVSRRLFAPLLVLIGLTLTACDSDNNRRAPEQTPTPPPPVTEEGPGTIAEVAAEAGDFETLITALEAAGLDAVVADDSQTLTVFAPTDEAFEALPEGTLDALLNDVEALENVLLYHVIADSAVGSDAALDAAGTTIPMANGSDAAITLRGEELYINEAVITVTDIEASNGVIHVIDAVIIPIDIGEPSGSIVDIALADERFTTLVTAVSAAGLVDTLADEDSVFTVFAPTNDAFAKLGEDTINSLLGDIPTLTDILLYHVVADAALTSIDATAAFGTMVTTASGDEVSVDIRDGALFINDSEIIIRDIPATNGIIHVIDTVLIPETSESTGTIVDVAVADGRFTTLVAAVEAADLVSVLSDENSVFTVFAPTDDAFAQLGDETINGLLADIPALTDVLLYHVLSDQAVDSATALTLDGSDVEMTNGATVKITVEGDMLKINDSTVIIADVQASNGIIHVIDAVLLPPEG